MGASTESIKPLTMACGINSFPHDCFTIGKVTSIAVAPAEEMAERGYRQPIKYINKIANILPKSELAKMSLDQILTRVNNFQSKYFDNVLEAKIWLKTK